MRDFIRVFALAAAACAYIAPAAAQSHSCVVFPPPYEGAVASASKLNNVNESVGTVYESARNLRRAAIFRADGTVKYLHDGPSEGTHINDSGNAVFRRIDDVNGVGLGLVYYDAASNTASPMPVPADPAPNVRVGGIDNANTVYGTTQLTGKDVPFKVEGGRFVDLSPVLGQAFIGGVSPAGDITGSKLVRRTTHAFRYRPSARRPVDLARVLGPVKSWGGAINTALAVVGQWVPGPTDAIKGFVVVGQTAFDVTFAGHDYSEVAAINAAGEAVGYSSEFPGAQGAPFVWRSGVATVLSCADRQVDRPVGINDQGVILDRLGVILVPLPPPPPN
jgi:hypothetical protein